MKQCHMCGAKVPKTNDVCLECTDEFNQPVVYSSLASEFTNSLLSNEKGSNMVFVNSGEWMRIQGVLLGSIDAEVKRRDNIFSKRRLVRYGYSTGTQGWDEERGSFTEDVESLQKHQSAIVDASPAEIIQWFNLQFDEPGILWFDDAHPFLNERNQSYGAPFHTNMMWALRRFARIRQEGPPIGKERKTIIITGENVILPEELVHDVVRMELSLPGFHTLRRAVEVVQEELKLKSEDVDKSEDFVNTALGLSIEQALAAYRQAAVLHGKLRGDEAKKTIIGNKRKIISQSVVLNILKQA